MSACSSPACSSPAVTWTPDGAAACSPCALDAYRAAAEPDTTADEDPDDAGESDDVEPLVAGPAVVEPAPAPQPAPEPTPPPRAPAWHWRLPAALDELLGPRLHRPACVGRAPLHDLDVHGESPADRQGRHARAIKVCERCRSLPACRAVLDDLPRDVVGVWAGVVLGGKVTHSNGTHSDKQVDHEQQAHAG